MVASELKPKNILIPFFVHVFPVLRFVGQKGWGYLEGYLFREVTKKTFTYEHTEPIKLAIKYVLRFGSLGKALVTVN